MARNEFLFTTIILISVITIDAVAKDKPWHKYENDYFEAYSDASEKKVRRLLEELENFRAAVIQLNGGRVPDGAVKTQVVIFDSKRQFQETIDRKWADAYAVGIRGIQYIVMSAGRMSEWSRTTIRHEFTHVLQGYNNNRSPPWYVEGFAEFMSGMTFRNKNTEFIIGDFPGRTKARVSFGDWNELISDDFEFHQIESSAKASNAYLQSWLLVHYLTIGDGLAHNKDLIEYLTVYSKGAESIAAFSEVFGESANDMGPRIYKQYSKRFQPMVLNFLPNTQDHSFIRTPAASDFEIEIVDELKSIHRARID